MGKLGDAFSQALDELKAFGVPRNHPRERSRLGPKLRDAFDYRGRRWEAVRTTTGGY